MLLTQLDYYTMQHNGEKRIVSSEDLEEIISSGGITPHFQPIFDLFTGDIFGYELLSRAPAFPGDTSELFKKANDWGLSMDLELACRMAALKRLSQIQKDYQSKHFFMNVSPHSLADPEFHAGLAPVNLVSMGLDVNNIVIEITETFTVQDYEGFEEQIRHFVNQGFHVALDDFGAGHSGLITLIAATPHFLKIDREIIRDINVNSYKQNLVKAISAFASNVETYIIAEGIECMEELETVFRLGARYGQGYLLGKPAPNPETLTDAKKKILHSLIDEYNHTRFAVDISIAKLVTRPLTVNVGEMTCADLDYQFQRNHAMDHIVIQNNSKPVGLLTRQHFYSAIGGRYGYSFFQKRFIEQIPMPDMLIVEEKMDLRVLGKLAMSRSHNDLYNPVVITNVAGNLVGTVTIKQLLSKAFDMEIKIASMANPLTGLPGNIIIGVWLEEAVKNRPFTVIYCDLSNFKEYNDHYGFARGDDMIKLAAKVLQKNIQPCGKDCRVGHIGGDDFIIVAEDVVVESMLVDICTDFDMLKSDFFSSEHISTGFYKGLNRAGQEVDVPLVSMILAVVTSENFQSAPHPGKLAEIAAHLKKKVKALNAETPKSGFLMERRIYDQSTL